MTPRSATLARNARGILKPLIVEMRKFPTYEAYEHEGWSRNIQRGLYWHFTSDSQFSIDPLNGPRDRSSLSATDEPKTGDLMVTSHFEHWDDFYNAERVQRPYAAQIDLGAYAPREYQQVGRGFGNEMYIMGAHRARVVGVYPRAEAQRRDAAFFAAMPHSEDELRFLYNLAHDSVRLPRRRGPPAPRRSRYT